MSVKTSNWLFGILMVVIIGISILATSCNKLNDNLSQVVSDYDGNVYHTVIINGQEWMTENLKVIHFNDGTEIPLVEDKNAWNNLPITNSAGYCYYKNNESNKEIYGCLYNWNSINTKILAPVGWRVATPDDWKNLINYLGGLDVAGGKLKSTGMEYWDSPNEMATNESGLFVLPAGYRSDTGFTGLGKSTSLAGSDLIPDVSGQQAVFAVSAYSDQQSSCFWATGFVVGLSVRCVRNVNDGAK